LNAVRERPSWTPDREDDGRYQLAFDEDGEDALTIF
jgi:hypothetical protein